MKLKYYPEKVALEKVKGLAPDVHLLVGRHLDLPVALGLVRVVLGVLGSLDGHLVHNRKISHVTSGEDQGNLLSISQVALSVFAAQTCIPGICRLEKSESD